MPGCTAYWKHLIVGKVRICDSRAMAQKMVVSCHHVVPATFQGSQMLERQEHCLKLEEANVTSPRGPYLLAFLKQPCPHPDSDTSANTYNVTCTSACYPGDQAAFMPPGIHAGAGKPLLRVHRFSSPRAYKVKIISAVRHQTLSCCPNQCNMTVSIQRLKGHGKTWCLCVLCVLEAYANKPPPGFFPF